MGRPGLRMGHGWSGRMSATSRPSADEDTVGRRNWWKIANRPDLPKRCSLTAAVGRFLQGYKLQRPGGRPRGRPKLDGEISESA
jgi:hypothetical protein